MDEMLTVNGKPYPLLGLLGKGKGGYSYLALDGERQVVVKQIHHEPCAYYTFGNKIEAERRDYQRLRSAGIRIPRMLDLDTVTERIVKEYIPGPVAAEILRCGGSVEEYLPQVREMSRLAEAAGLNIDYYPTNFVLREGLVWYIDYECNLYDPRWSFPVWGLPYWTGEASL